MKLHSMLLKDQCIDKETKKGNDTIVRPVNQCGN